MNFFPAPDQILDGYRLIRFLGRGGFGEVWLCRSESMGDVRALKWIPASHGERLEKEHRSLLHFRSAAAGLRSPHLVPIEHVNRNESGLYYVMPLADGTGADSPADPAWKPLSLSLMLHAQAARAEWFSSKEIINLIRPVLEALQILSDTGLVHRDVKPDNILLFGGKPCLGDISLLGEDAATVTRRGTHGYVTPTWYAGGHPDMYGAAATLYTLLTGNAPDKMGRSSFLWPPQGESTLTESERSEWRRLHSVIRRATEEKVSERFVDFRAMAGAVSNHTPANRGSSRRVVSALVLGTAAAAAVISGIFGKYPATRNPGTSARSTEDAANDPNPAENEQFPELTPEERADYTVLAGMIQGYIQDGKYENALTSIEMLLSTYPQARRQPAYSIARAMALKELGRIDEAKQELKRDLHISPQISALTARTEMWEEFGDLTEAEDGLTRVLDQHGPNTFVLLLRAGVRAKRGDFAGMQADRESAYEIKPVDPGRRDLVDTLWAPLETKYPGYGQYLEENPPADAGSRTTENNGPTHDDAWIMENFDSIMRDITNPGPGRSSSAMRANATISALSLEAFREGRWSQALGLLNQTYSATPVLANTPALSLYRALLLQRLGRQEEANQELARSCHRNAETRLIDARVCLLNALGRRIDAEKLLNEALAGWREDGERTAADGIQLLGLRARIRAIRGDYEGVRGDYREADALATGDADAESSVQNTWEILATTYPAYADYIETLSGK